MTFSVPEGAGPSIPRPGRQRIGRSILLAAILCVLLSAAHSLAGGVVTSGALTNLYAALLGGGEVTFTLTSDTTYNLVAPIEIFADTTINASTTTRTVTFSGSDKVRLINVHPGVTLRLVNLRLIQGQSTNGGALYVDSGTLLATNCVFQSNTAEGGDGEEGAPGGDDFSFGGRAGDGADGGNAFGGAIYNHLGRIECDRCEFLGNEANGGNGGDGGKGGDGGLQGGQGGDGGVPGVARGAGIFNSGGLVLRNCSFESSHARAGDGGVGGASGSGGSNQAVDLPGHSRPGTDAVGGAIYSSGDAALTGCTFTTNRVTGGVAADEYADPSGWGRPGRDGGAALGGAIASEGTLALTNCTFVANAAAGGDGGDAGDGTQFRGGVGGDGGRALGGGLWTRGSAVAVNCTLADGNVLGGAGGAAGEDQWDLDPIDPPNGRPGSAAGGNVVRDEGSLTFVNCLVANATAGGNGQGGITDGGNNLSSDGTCEFGAPGSLNNIDPKLGALGAYGGSTETLPLLAGSPAIDAGQSVSGVTADQRGTSRPQGDAYDIGAFERSYATLSGRVKRSNGAPYAGVLLSLFAVTGSPATTSTDLEGRYQFDPEPGVDLGVYRIQPPPNGLLFAPTYRDVLLTNASQIVTNLDFTAGGERIVSYGFTAEGLFQFRLQGEATKTYLIESSADLRSWEPLGEGTTDAAGVLDFTDPASPLPATRFYRAAGPDA